MAILKESTVQSAHWYTRDGKALHTVPNADGDGTRPTTLADARKLGLFPSVSSILGVLDKPGLDKWKREQVALAAMTLKRTKAESDEYFMDRIIAESGKVVRNAQDHGIGVHGELDRYFAAKINKSDYAPNAVTFSHVKPAIEWIESVGIVPVVSEVVLINHEHGFGGTSDLPFRWKGGQEPGTLDYKTKKTEPGVPIEAYPDQAMQIAAYSATYWKESFGRVYGINLFMSSNEPGRCERIVYTPQQLAAEWEIFKMLCIIWRHLNQYDPRTHGMAAAVFHGPRHAVITGPGGTKPDHAKLGEPAKSTAPTPPPAPPPALVAQVVAGQTEFPATGPTMLDLLNKATLENTADGIKFLSPADCCALGGTGKTDYAWWYHKETNAGKVSLRGDAGLSAHGWMNCFLAYPADARDIARTETKGKGTPPPPPKDELPLTKGENVKKRSTAEVKKRIAEIEAMPVTFGKFKGHAKIKTIGDLPETYLGYLRDVDRVPDYIKEYLAFPTVITRIEKAIK